MGTIIFRMIKDKRFSITIYIVAGILFLWMYVAMFPSLAAQQEGFDQFLESFPDVFKETFNLNDFSFSQVENFLAVEYFSIIWPLMLIFLATSIASSSIAREIETGTIEMVLARPVSRAKVFFSRYIAGMAVLLAFVVLTIFTVVPLAALHNVEYQLQNYVTVALLGLLFGWSVFSIAMAFSSFFSEKSKVSMTIGGILLLMYVLNLVSTLKDSFGSVKYLSFFYYFDYNKALIHNELNPQSVWVFIGLALVATSFGVWRFMKRDVAI